MWGINGTRYWWSHFLPAHCSVSPTFGDHHCRVRNWYIAYHADDFLIVLYKWLNGRIFYNAEICGCYILRTFTCFCDGAPSCAKSTATDLARLIRSSAWMGLSSQSGGLVLQTRKVMSGREGRHKTKYFGLGGGFGMVDMILGGVVLESRRNAVDELL
jgi:hypothetical protein